jgi:hypothetical protein
MKVVVLSPKRVFLAGAVSALLVLGCMLGAMAAAGVFRTEAAEAYGTDGVGAKRWYFAEGYTGPGFEEWILVYNPPKDFGGSGIYAGIHMSFYNNDGYFGYYDWTTQPGQRASFNINDILSSLNYSGDVSIIVNSSQPIICERAMYFDYKGQMAGGSQILGYQEGAAE